MKALLVLLILVASVPVIAQTLPNSTPEQSYQSVMSRAGGESYVRQEPVTQSGDCHKPAGYCEGYGDYWSGGGSALPAEPYQPSPQGLRGSAKRRAIRELERQKRAEFLAKLAAGQR